MKLSKVLHFLAAVVVVMPIAVFAWVLSRPLPSIDPPRVPIDDRTSLDPERGSHISSTYWDEEILSKFGEDSLIETAGKHGEIIYRFILLPTFDKPVCVRIANRDGRIGMAVKVLSGLGGYGLEEFGSLSTARERDLSSAEWNELQRLIEESSFWYTPRVDRNDIPVTDGATWVLEGVTESYHLVDRITPSPELERVMKYMLELAGLTNEYEGYYHER